MNIGIIGGGAIGLLVSSYLGTENNVTIYVQRKVQQEKIEKEQLTLLKSSAFFHKVTVSVKLIKELTSHDCLIVCVKQTDIQSVISYINQLKIMTPLIFFQNGMGHLDVMKKLRHPSYVGVVEHGAYRINDNTVNHLGEGIIKMAAVTGNKQQLNDLVSKLDQVTFPIQRVDDVFALLKNKLIINAVINPLTALFDVPNGAIITNKHIRFLAEKICMETASVLKLDVKKSWESVLETAKNTSKNVSSMRADLQKKSKTEIEAISGYILKEAPEALPYTTFVYHAILTKESIEIVH